MLRLARRDVSGLMHYIIIRGIERSKLFRNDEDGESVIERISVLLPETETTCYA